MTELEVLARSINGLTELLRVAWRDLANPLLTPFERREALADEPCRSAQPDHRLNARHGYGMRHCRHHSSVGRGVQLADITLKASATSLPP
jgi:hypothetical protein